MPSSIAALNVSLAPRTFRAPGLSFIKAGPYCCWPAEIWDIESPLNPELRVGRSLSSRNLALLANQIFPEPQKFGFTEVTPANVTPFLNRVLEQGASGEPVDKVDQVLCKLAQLLARVVRGFREGTHKKVNIPSAFPWQPGEKERLRSIRHYVIGGGAYAGAAGERFIALAQRALQREGIEDTVLTLSRWGKSVGVIGAANLAGLNWPQAQDSWVAVLDLGGTSFKGGVVKIGAGRLFAGCNLPREEVREEPIAGDDFLKFLWKDQHRGELALIGWQSLPEWLVPDWWHEKYTDVQRFGLRDRFCDLLSERLDRLLEIAGKRKINISEVVMTSPCKFDFVDERYVAVGSCVYPMWGTGAGFTPQPFDVEKAIETRLAEKSLLYRVTAVNDCLACGLGDPQPENYFYLGMGYGLGGAYFEKK